MIVSDKNILQFFDVLDAYNFFGLIFVTSSWQGSGRGCHSAQAISEFECHMHHLQQVGSGLADVAII